MLTTGTLTTGNCYISGDDRWWREGSLAHSVDYWTALGYARKDKDPLEPSVVVKDFEQLEFCSHKPIKIGFTTEDGTFQKLVPTRGQYEILAKLVYSVGAFFNEETQAAHALSLRNYLIKFLLKEMCGCWYAN